MKRWIPAASLLVAACAASPGESPGPSGPPVVEVRAALLPEAIAVDGVAEPAWDLAPEVRVPLEGIAGPASCTVRAAVAGGALHLLVRWEDATEDREHKPWVRAGDRPWASGTEREDVLAVAFPMDGEFTASMLSPMDASWDVWHWKAGRTDPAGHAMDRMHRMALADPGGKRTAHRLPDGTVVHILRPEDAGTSVTEELKEPAGGDRAPRYRARTPSGSAADVAARGAWRAGAWTVELSRALSTGHPDDRDLAGLRDVPFALAILDRAEDEDHASSPPLRLLLPDPDAR